MTEQRYDDGCSGDGCPSGCSNCREYEITSVDTGKTFIWTERKCQEFFGEAEFNEIRQGYLPNIIAVML